MKSPRIRHDWSTALDVARKALGVKTETETVDAALDAIAFRKEISEGVRRLRAAGGLKDIYRE